MENIAAMPRAAMPRWRRTTYACTNTCSLCLGACKHSTTFLFQKRFGPYENVRNVWNVKTLKIVSGGHRRRSTGVTNLCCLQPLFATTLPVQNVMTMPRMHVDGFTDCDGLTWLRRCRVAAMPLQMHCARSWSFSHLCSSMLETSLRSQLGSTCDSWGTLPERSRPKGFWRI